MKKNGFYLLSLTFLIVFSASAQKPKKASLFSSLDGLAITADEYKVSRKAPTIILCHQAGYSRGEYTEIAPKLNELGFNCLAIDQRSGNEVNDIKNETNQKAKEKNLPTAYLDAEQDIIAAIQYVFKKTGKPVILWGSSYSASLVLKIANNNEKVGGVLSFSPGEYFGEKMNLKKEVKGLNKPTYLTSSRKESDKLLPLFMAMNTVKVELFVPKGSGEHGSKALWKSKADHNEYWESVKSFLENVK